MAYQADILINVRGFQDLALIQKQLEGTARKIDAINLAAARMGAPTKTLERFTAQLALAERSLQKVAIGSPQEQRAISNYVTALNNSNTARDRQNKLIQTEINTRNAATNAIRANVEANIAESQALRAARAEAQQLNTELVQQERLRRKLAERGLMQLSGGGVAKGVADAGFGVQGPKLPSPKLPPAKQPTGLQAPGVMDAILGAGFPALFGGGPGAIAGGGIGGFIGGAMGGMAGMALSIGLSAVGQQIDEAVKKVKELGDAINRLDVDKLRDSFIEVNAELATTVRRMLEVGNAEAARNELSRQVAMQTGAVGSAIEDSANATSLLGNAWTDLTGSVGTLLSILAAPFSAALAGILTIVSTIVKGVNLILSVVGGGIKLAIEGIIKSLPGGERILQAIKNVTSATNEELEKQKAALVETTDAIDRQLRTAIRLEQIDKQRTNGITTMGKLMNIEADRQAKLVNVRAAAEQKSIDLRLKYGNLTDAQSKKDLETALKQVQAQAALETREANRAALRQRLVVINEQLVSQDKLALQIATNQAAVESARSQSQQQVLQTQVNTLELEKQFVLSLNQQTALNDQIAAKKIASANEIFAQTKRELDFRVAIAAMELKATEAAFQRGFATETQLIAARDNLNTTIATRDELLKGAEATRTQAGLTAEVERRQKNVADYAAEAARQTAAFNRQANEQLNALNNSLNVIQAYSQAQQTINNLQIQSLQSNLQLATSTSARLVILNKIRDLEILNAKIALNATRAQIKAEVERQRIALAIAQVKYQELRSVVALAKAEGVIKQEHLDALAAQQSALNIAVDNYNTSLKVANEQWRAADAVYEAAVRAADFKASMEATASAAQQTAVATKAAAEAAGTVIAGFTQGEANPAQVRRALNPTPSRKAFAAEIGKGWFQVSRQTVPEEITSRREELQQEMMNKLFDLLRGNRNNTNDTSGGTGPINIQTGPILQQDGNKYVTLEDMESALRSMASTMYSSNRAAGTQRFTGVR